MAPDSAFLLRHGADAVPALRRAVETLDRELGPVAGVRFRIGGATLFPATVGVKDDLRVLWETRLRLARGGCDFIAAFTGEECGSRAGAALPRLRLVLCADAFDLERNLLHETAHLFGALDFPRGHPGYATPTPMSYDSDQPRTLTLDPLNARRVAASRGVLPPSQPDPAGEALGLRLQSLPSGAGAALLGAFLCAESRRSQRDGLSPAERFLAEHPEDAVAAWIYGECRRVEGDRSDAAALFLLALQGIAGEAKPDGLHRHAALEMARLAVDSIDGLATLSSAAALALERLAVAFPADAEILDLRASLRARDGDLAGAQLLYREAAAADPDAAFPWWHLAALGRTTGDRGLWLEGWREATRRTVPGRTEAPSTHGDLTRAVEDALLAVRRFPDLLKDAAMREEVLPTVQSARALWPLWEPAILLTR